MMGLLSRWSERLTAASLAHTLSFFGGPHRVVTEYRADDGTTRVEIGRVDDALHVRVSGPPGTAEVVRHGGEAWVCDGDGWRAADDETDPLLRFALQAVPVTAVLGERQRVRGAKPSRQPGWYLLELDASPAMPAGWFLGEGWTRAQLEVGPHGRSPGISYPPVVANGPELREYFEYGPMDIPDPRRPVA